MHHSSVQHRDAATGQAPRPQDARELQRDAAAAVLERAPTTTAVDAPRRSRPVLACAPHYSRRRRLAPARRPNLLCAPKGLKNEHAACAFAAPAGPRAVGSWLLRTGLKRGAEMDFGVELPDALVTMKDLANGRYLAKRAAYLDRCAGGVAGARYQVTKAAFQRDEERPILEVADDEGGAVRVLVVWQAPAKALLLLGPSRGTTCGPPTVRASSRRRPTTRRCSPTRLWKGHLRPRLFTRVLGGRGHRRRGRALKARRRAQIATRRRRLDGVAGAHTHRSIPRAGMAPGRGPVASGRRPERLPASMVACCCCSSAKAAGSDRRRSVVVS